MRFILLIIIFLFGNKTVFAQLEFTQSKRTLLFISAEIIENKYIIAGVYIKPIDSTHLRLDVSISDDWIPEDSLDIVVTLDSSSLSNSYYIHNPYSNDSSSCYIFKNDQGYSIKIAKETYHNSKDKEGNPIKKYFQSDMVQISLPQSRRNYVSRLPIMFKK